MADDTAHGAGETVQVAGERIQCGDALAIVAGYCLGDDAVSWPLPRLGVGDPVGELRMPAFAYRTYDCIKPDPSPGLGPIDVLVANGLNAQMRARDIAGVLAVADAVSESLAPVAEDVTFWDLDELTVSDPPAEGDLPGWPIWRAWSVLMSVDGVDLARALKILHHKRPAVFPLIDNQTGPRLNLHMWAQIHRDLMATSEAWSRLEAATNEMLLDRPRGVALTPLRLHDILLWCDATGWTEAAKDLGKQIVDGRNPLTPPRRESPAASPAGRPTQSGERDDPADSEI